MKIRDRNIGDQSLPYVVAELSSNHTQDLHVAKALLEGCAAAGVDAVKIQTYTAETMTLDVELPDYYIQDGLWQSQRLFDLYQVAQTPWEWTEELLNAASGLGLAFFSTPFDLTAVEFLETFDMPAYKIASFELTDLPLLRSVAKTGKPIIASTGMATHGEIAEAVDELTAHGCTQLALLKCTSSYPARHEALNLRLIPQMKADFGVPIGYSDHTIGKTASIAAVALGACIIEKHVMLADTSSSPDAAFSASLDQMSELVRDVRAAAVSRGSGDYEVSPDEDSMRRLRRSVIAFRDIPANKKIEYEDLTVRRPAVGLPPRELPSVAGRRAARDIKRGEGITWDLLES